MRPTDFCFPSLDYEHPYLVGFRPVHWAISRERAVPVRFGGLGGSRHRHSASAGLAMTSFFNRLRGVFFPVTTRKTEPLTPLSPPSIRLRMGLLDLSSSEPSKVA